MSQNTTERAIRVYSTKKTFFSKIGTTFNKLFSPTKQELNNFLLNMKRNTMLKNFKNTNKENIQDDKKEMYEKKFEESYTLYLEAIDQFVVDTIYQKVRNGNASEFEKDALSNYYNVIRLKDEDKKEYSLKKKQYLLDLDFYDLKENGKKKTFEEYKELYIYEIDQIYKELLKNYSIKLAGRLDENKENQVFNKIFDTIESYAINVVPMKNIKDNDLLKLCDMLSSYEVGKFDEVDIIDKKLILIGISRKLFIHSLPLVVAEKCYIELLKETRKLIIDTKVIRKREAAYQLLIKIFNEYNNRLLKNKIYWRNAEEKKTYKKFEEKIEEVEKNKNHLNTKDYEIQKQILYIKQDMKILRKYGNKYNKIIDFYKVQLIKLGDKRKIYNKPKKLENVKFTKKLEIKEGKEKINEQQKQAC